MPKSSTLATWGTNLVYDAKQKKISLDVTIAATPNILEKYVEKFTINWQIESQTMISDMVHIWARHPKVQGRPTKQTKTPPSANEGCNKPRKALLSVIGPKQCTFGKEESKGSQICWLTE